VNVAEHLARAHAERGDDPAIILARDDSRLSFFELDWHSSSIAQGFKNANLLPGDRMLVMVRPGPDLIRIVWACFKCGVLPVLIDPGMGLFNFLRCVERIRPAAMAGIEIAHLISLIFPFVFSSVKQRIYAGRRVWFDGHTIAELIATPGPYVVEEAEADTPAAILFTSGSTGPAKGVHYTHGNFDAQVRSLRETYGYASGQTDVAAFPPFSLFDPALGMTSVIPDLDPSRMANTRPEAIAHAMRHYRAQNVFGSPVIWRSFAPWAEAQGATFPDVQRLMIAGASVPPRLIAQLRRAVPNGDVGTPYGATEALPVAAVWGKDIVERFAQQSAEGRGTCVGRPAQGIEIRIIAINDAPILDIGEAPPLPPGEVGEICVKGPVVTTLYVDNADATERSKIPDGSDTWHRMGDLGYQDGDGNLWFCGRKAERVGELYTDNVEGRFNPWCGRTALVGVRGEPVLVVEGPEDAALEQRILDTSVVKRVVFHKAFPVDARHNSKIHRHTLAKWAERTLK